MRLSRILLVNSHNENTGDRAIVLTMLKHMRQICPDARITVSCAKPELPMDGDAVYREYPLPVFESYPKYKFSDLFRGFLVLSSNFLSAFCWRLLRKRFFLFNSGKKEILNDFFDADVVVSVGGGFISSDYSFLRPYHDIMLAKLLGKPVVLYAHSLGPFNTSMGKLASRLVLKSADVIIVRDGPSAQNLEGLGIKNYHTTADIAFDFTGFKKKPKTGKVILCPRKWLRRNSGSSKRYIGFLHLISKRLMSEYGSEIVFLPTDPEDLEFHSFLRQHMPGGITFIDKIHAPHTAAELMSEADFVISSRLHPIVLASLSATPFFGLGWEHKVEEASSMLCDTPCSLRADNLDSSAEELIMQRMKERKKLSAEIEKKLPHVRKKARRTLTIFKESLEGLGYSFDS